MTAFAVHRLIFGIAAYGCLFALLVWPLCRAAAAGDRRTVVRCHQPTHRTVVDRAMPEAK